MSSDHHPGKGGLNQWLPVSQGKKKSISASKRREEDLASLQSPVVAGPKTPKRARAGCSLPLLGAWGLGIRPTVLCEDANMALGTHTGTLSRALKRAK